QRQAARRPPGASRQGARERREQLQSGPQHTTGPCTQITRGHPGVATRTRAVRRESRPSKRCASPFVRLPCSRMLTRRQKELLDYLAAHITRHGYAPTLDEIGRHFALASVATVHKHLRNLARKRL